jgi:hypothetical protein
MKVKPAGAGFISSLTFKELTMQQANPTPEDQPQQPASPIGVSKRAVKSQIIADYKQGLSLRKVGTRVHTDVNFVSAVITQAGLMRANGEGRRGRPSRKPNSVDKWKVIEGRSAGKPTAEIAKELNRGLCSIGSALTRMGWNRKVFHSFGEVFDRPALRRLYEMSGFLSVSEMAQKLGMPSPTLAQQVSTTRIPGQELDFDTARKVAQWRESLFSA